MSFLTRDQIRSIVTDVVRESSTIAKTVGRDLVKDVGAALEKSMKRSGIEGLHMTEGQLRKFVRSIIAEKLDPTNLQKSDRPEDAQSLISTMRRGKGSSPYDGK